MNGRNMGPGEKIWFFLIASGIFAVVVLGETLEEHNLILPVVVLVFILGFGFLAYQISKDWKQPDEKILDMEEAGQNNVPPSTTKKRATYEERRKLFFASLVFIAFILLRKKRITAGTLISCGIVLTAGCVYFVPAWIQKRRGKEGQPLFPNAKLQPEQIFYMLFSLFGVCFCGFWIYMVLSNIPQFWWFSIPGFIIGAGISRPLVAGIRILLRRPRDPGEKHVRKAEETDPWDRPDKKYDDRN